MGQKLRNFVIICGFVLGISVTRNLSDFKSLAGVVSNSITRAAGGSGTILGPDDLDRNIDPAERAAAKGMKDAPNPNEAEIKDFRAKTRAAFEKSRFDDLEKTVQELRTNKTQTSAGGWMLYQLYDSLSCNDHDPESAWRQHDKIHLDWIKAKPKSAAARIAYANYFTDYAWLARGSGAASTVSSEGWKIFRERMATARGILANASQLPEKDPMWWSVGLSVALGEHWTSEQYDAFLADAHAFEPTFWNYDIKRAFSLLPRWAGKSGDWEAYALKTTTISGGLGAETYARIVMNQSFYYENVFRETNAQWSKTKEGIALIMQKYPNCPFQASQAALLAVYAGDQAFAQEMFTKFGDNYQHEIWEKPERFVNARHWAQTGKW